MEIIKRILGIVFIGGSVVLVYIFGVWGIIDTKEVISKEYQNTFLPFCSLFLNYPRNAIILITSLLLLLSGLILFLASKPLGAIKSPTQLFLANSVLAVAFLWLIFVGSMANPETNVLAIFSIVFISQLVVGLILFVKSRKERPISIPSLILASLLYLFCVGVCVVSVFMAK